MEKKHPLFSETKFTKTSVLPCSVPRLQRLPSPSFVCGVPGGSQY